MSDATTGAVFDRAQRGAVVDVALGAVERLRERLSKARRAATLPRERLVVIGNGMVGHRLCERLVELGASARYRIVVLGEEATPAYDRVHLTDVLKGRPRRELVLRASSWYAEHGLELRLSERAERIDRAARMVLTAKGEIPFDRLVLATGSRAFLPPIELRRGAELLPYRTLDDAERILAMLEARKGKQARVAVIGGGLLGIEAARTLQTLGCSVVVLEASSQLLPRQLDPAAAEELLRVLTRAGIDLRPRSRIRSVTATSGGVRIELEGAEPIDAAVVVAAAGARACDELARAAGLRCNARGGVEVNAELCTSDPRIHAIGECARHASVPVGLVAPGYAMADVLASRLAEQRGRLGAQHAVTRLKLDVTEVTVLGNPLEAVHDQELVHVAPGCYRRLLLRRSRVVAAVVVGAWQELATLQRLVVSSRRVDRRSLVHFSHEGRLGTDKASLPVVQWPSATVVCQCANVTAGVLRQSFATGSATPDALGRATSAGTLCGSCRPLLAAICGADTPPVPEKNRLLLPGAAALFFGLAVALAPRIDFPEKLADWSVHAAFTDTQWKQLSGFAVLAVIGAALLLSLRKRVRRLSLGSYAGWRLAHAVLGALALVGLFAHTGFRLGNNLNLALSIAFLTSGLSGALSAIAPASLSRVSAVCRRAHDYAFWSLPALITFHVVKSYYF